jgi:NADP-dependent 3-hydroxy acid dehydrogenase YdfG
MPGGQPLETRLRKVALISGSSAGLGEAAARALAGRGFDLFLGGRDRARLARLQADLQRSHPEQVFHAHAFDVRRQDEIAAAVAECRRLFPRLDLLVTSAGVGVMDFLDRLDPALGVVSQIETNLTGTILLVRAVLPWMIDRRSGTIVLIGSLAGRVATPTYSVYAATKFGLVGFAESLRREVGIWGIRVSLLLPGAVDTALGAESVARRRSGFRTPRRWVLRADQVGEAVADLAARPRRMKVLPGWMRPLLWLARSLPGVVDRITERAFVRIERADELSRADSAAGGDSPKRP